MTTNELKTSREVAAAILRNTAFQIATRTTRESQPSDISDALDAKGGLLYRAQEYQHGTVDSSKEYEQQFDFGSASLGQVLKAYYESARSLVEQVGSSNVPRTNRESVEELQALIARGETLGLFTDGQPLTGERLPAGALDKFDPFGGTLRGVAPRAKEAPRGIGAIASGERQPQDIAPGGKTAS